MKMKNLVVALVHVAETVVVEEDVEGGAADHLVALSLVIGLHQLPLTHQNHPLHLHGAHQPGKESSVLFMKNLMTRWMKRSCLKAL